MSEEKIWADSTRWEGLNGGPKVGKGGLGGGVPLIGWHGPSYAWSFGTEVANEAAWRPLEVAPSVSLNPTEGRRRKPKFK